MMEAPPRSRYRIPAGIVTGVTTVLLVGGFMFYRAGLRTNKVALQSTPKGVMVAAARAAIYRPRHRYIGTTRPWVEAHLGPQLTSAYVDTVLVRPGAFVKRGQVLATLDCRDASAASKAVAMQARALEAKQEAIAHEATRVSGLLEGGFVSPNEAEQKSAETTSKEADVLATRAKLLRASLEVDDCVLRAPFDGEVADRTSDPGAFARPGASIVTVIDRRTARVTADVPESDFGAVAPGTPVEIHLFATGIDLTGKIARRSPAADLSTRTIYFEIDIPDPERRIPVGTTAELTIEIGKPSAATEIPLVAASVRGGKVTVLVVQGNVVHKTVVGLMGETQGRLFVETALKPGTPVVTEGRANVKDGDRVTAQMESAPETIEPPSRRGSPGRTTVAQPAADGTSASPPRVNVPTAARHL